MAVPKRRTSKRKKRARNTHKAAARILLQGCPQCNAPKRPHHVCPSCGHYAEREVVALNDEIDLDEATKANIAAAGCSTSTLLLTWVMPMGESK